MALDLARTVGQIDSLARRLHDRRDERADRLARTMAAMAGADAGELRRKLDSAPGRPFLCPGLVGGLSGRHQPAGLPRDFCVAATDGSHIDVDRHTPVRCYLINVGGCLLTYGSQPDARLFSDPVLYSEEPDLYLGSGAPGSMEAVAVEGPVLGLKRAVEEIRALAGLVEEAPPEMPVLALIDGSLVLWALAGRGYQPFVRDRMIVQELLPALDRLQEASRSRPVALAAYVSLPQSTEVTNLLRLYLCPHDSDTCRAHCNSHRSRQTPCDTVNELLDRHLFEELLAPGERSDTFLSQSSISRDWYGQHRVHFFYVNTRREIGRVEVPGWVAADEALVSLCHALILDQCERGIGYPVAIAESHEQAVVTGPDRLAFRQMVDEALEVNGLPVYTSEKARSKRTRWL